MRHLYYTLQTLLRGHGGTAEKIISLTLGLAMGVLLFAQIAYELSFDRFYPNPDTLVMLRMRDVNKGVPDYAYNYGTYRPAAADLSEAFPELVESASLTSNFWTPTFYKDDKKLEDIQTLFADTAYFATTGLPLLQGNPKDLGVQGNAFISESMARRLYGDESPIGKVLSVEKLFDVTIRGIYADVPRNSIMPHDLLLSMAALDWAYGRGTWNMNNLYGVLFRLKQPADVDAMNSRIQQAVEQYTDPHLGDDVVTEYSVLPIHKVYRSYPDSTRRLVILGVLGFSIFFVSILNYVLRAVAAMSRRAKQVGVHKCSGADGWHILSMFLWETGLLVVASILCGGVLLWLLREQVEELLGSRLTDLFTWQTLYVPLGTVLLLFQNGKAALRKRADTGLLASLWEFPSVLGNLDEAGVSLALAQMGLSAQTVEPTGSAKHIFTHVEWRMTGYALTVRGDGPAELEWVDAAGLAAGGNRWTRGVEGGRVGVRVDGLGLCCDVSG